MKKLLLIFFLFLSISCFSHDFRSLLDYIEKDIAKTTARVSSEEELRAWINSHHSHMPDFLCVTNQEANDQIIKTFSSELKDVKCIMIYVNLFSFSSGIFFSSELMGHMDQLGFTTFMEIDAYNVKVHTLFVKKELVQFMP